MLEKVLKIIDIINSCKFISQLEQCLITIENFERDEKPRDERIVKELKNYYEVKYSKLEISKLKVNETIKIIKH